MFQASYTQAVVSEVSSGQLSMTTTTLLGLIETLVVWSMAFCIMVGFYGSSGIGNRPVHGFLDDHGTFAAFNVPGIPTPPGAVPGPTSTEIFGINDSNQIVGSWLQENVGGSHGFIATPTG